MRKSFIETVEKQGLIRPGDRVLVAVSGGRDSVVLLHLLLNSAEALSCSLRVAHLDHGMRTESRADAAFVRQLCKEWGLPFFCGRSDVPTLARDRRQGLEETAREERRRFLRQVAEEESCDVIALGHHRGDQAETFIYRLLRGSGSAGLAAMQTRNDIFVRPLLNFSPESIESYLCRHALRHVEDSSNRDMRFTRNRIRRQVLPVLRELQPAVDESVARLCRQLAAETDFWREHEERSLDALSRHEGAFLRLACSGLLALHPALRPRVIRQALFRVRGDLHGIDAGHVARIERLIEDGPPQGEADLPRAWVGRRYDQLLLGLKPPETPPGYSVAIEGPGHWPLPCGGRLIVGLREGQSETNDRQAEFSADLTFPLQLRTFRPGDRIVLPRLAGRKKVKDLFIDAKVDRELRGSLPLLVKDDEILWAVGLRRSVLYPPRAGAGKVLRIEVFDCPPVDNWLVNSRGL